MAKSPYPHPDKLERYQKLLAAAKAELKGATMPYTSVNGHMHSFLDKEGNMSLRLEAKDLEAFIKKYKAKPSVQHGTVMKEYALVPDALFRKTAELKKWFEKSAGYVKGLKPKK